VELAAHIPECFPKFTLNFIEVQVRLKVNLGNFVVWLDEVAGLRSQCQLPIIKSAGRVYE